jgi:hypothetical protein
VEEKPDTSAAALYAMKPKRKSKPAGPESATNDGVTAADVAGAAPADADTEGGDE